MRRGLPSEWGGDKAGAWAESSTRQSFINRVAGLLEGGDQHQIRTGIDFWFTPERVTPPKSWKQFLLTVTAVYPLSLLIPRVLDPLYRVVPTLAHPLISSLLMALSLTALLTFVVMPHLTKLAKRWLYENH